MNKETLKLLVVLILTIHCSANTIQLLRVRKTEIIYTSQYTIHQKELTWYEARAECESCGGNLVTIDDSAEHTYLVQKLNELKVGQVWIGLNDRASEGRFRWVKDDSEDGFKQWCNGQPNNVGGHEDCVELRDKILGNCLNDRPCGSYRLPFICEVNIHKTLTVNTF
ncbi:echinoidin-like [Clytia hemisphaerica]|uniref:echinoidin-like n=1 Tax=Clytia hemisphaerica TaxID=252671 RepID=UPI0034D4DCD1